LQPIVLDPDHDGHHMPPIKGKGEPAAPTTLPGTII
jgi:hypothetical protein